jgi:hypothetical protein
MTAMTSALSKEHKMTFEPIIVRHAVPEDRSDLARLAQLDSARPLSGPVLVAESGGELRAAWSVRERRAIADPFKQTAGEVALLRVRADLLLAA